MSGAATIIGAGPAGLCLAYFLAQRGVHSTVISADDGPGGLARSIPFAGRQVDLGPHAFYASYGRRSFEVLNSFFGPEELHTVKPRRAVRTASFLAHAPLRARDLLQPGLWKQAIEARLRGQSFRDVLFGSWCIKHFGRTAAELDPSLRTLLASERRVGKDGRCVHPVQGAIGTLWTRMADRLAEQGTTFHWGTRVEGLRLESGSVVACSTSSGEHLLQGPLYSTAPLHTAAQWVGFPVSASLPRRSTILVFTTVEAYRTTAHHLTDHRPEEPIARVTFCDNWRRPVPPKGPLVVCMELWCEAGDAVHGLEQKALLERVASYLRASNLVVPMAAPGHLVIGPFISTPVPLPGYQAEVYRMRASLGKIHGLHVLGRHANHRWDGVDDAVDEAYQLAMPHAQA